MLRTQPARVPCSAMIQNSSPLRPLVTGTLRILPDRRPRVSRMATPNGLMPIVSSSRIRGLRVYRWNVRASSTLARRLQLVSRSRPR